MNIPGFKPYTPRPRAYRSMITCSQGHPKRGKSNYALTKPSPHAYIDLDESIEGLMPKFEGKEIYVCTAERPSSNKPDDYVRCYSQLEKAYNDALKIPGLRSLTIDQGSDFWEIMRMAKFGKLLQVPPLRYTEINAEFIGLIASAKDYDINVTWIHRVKESYVGNNKSGKYERVGFGDLAYKADVVIEHDRATDIYVADDGIKTPTTQFSIKILDCRQNPDVIGEELIGNDVCTFQTVACMVYPDADPAEFE